MARVTVNRFWQMYFGTGIVKTAEDFGSQGEPPSHPELLDWLATEFVRTGWDVKALQKTIVMSATYRQASRLSPELLAKDPDNRLLARGPNVRLSADIVRDQALAIAGLLTNKIGGPSVKPYQPEGLWNEVGGGSAYVQDHGDNLYRRSLYTFWRRSIPPPSMANFDASARENHMVRPVVTNTPLQALDLMNDVAYVEAARVFAQRVIKEGGKTPPERIAYAFRVATARQPEARGGRDTPERVPAERGSVHVEAGCGPEVRERRGISARQRRRRHRAGRVHQRDEPDPQPARNGDEGVVMDQRFEVPLNLTRRRFLGTAGLGIGAAALAELLQFDLLAQGADGVAAGATGGLPGLPHFAPKAKRVIYMFQSGAPSQLDLFDYKPQLAKAQGTDLPDSIRNGQRLTAMTAGQTSFPIAQSIFKFAQHGQSGAWLSELLPYTAKVADDLCFIKSMHTEQINHDPAVTFAQTGFQLSGRPSLGAWVSYGLGTINQDLPAFVVMITGNGQSLAERQWGTGFIPSRYQGVKLRSVGDPVLYVSDPAGFDTSQRARFISDLEKLNQLEFEATNNPEIATRIAQYEMAFRMQTSVPELTDLSKEPEHTFELYGPDSRKPGTYAANCLLARRLAERGVRFIQLYHRAWDHHSGLPKAIRTACVQADQPSAALVQDLKERGLLDETLVIWAGEFGRTVYSQGKLTADDYGRDHHPRAFTIWMAGGGIKPGITLGETDDYGYNITQDPVHIHDLNATILRCLGIDHKRLTYKYQGRQFRLTDTAGRVVQKALTFDAGAGA